MVELLALTRLAFLSCRYIVATMLVVITIGSISFVLLANSEHARADDIAVIGLTFTLFPAAMAAMVMFDYRSRGDLNSGQSGCDHWLLRLPVAAWKIAIIPAALKTLWVALLWVLLVAALFQLDPDITLSLILPPLVISGGLIWTLTISWRPMRSDLHRVIMLLVAMPVIYVGAGLVLVAILSRPERWQWYHKLGLWIVGVVFYLCSIWSLTRAIRLAKVAADGIIPAEASKVRFLDQDRSTGRVQHADETVEPSGASFAKMFSHLVKGVASFADVRRFGTGGVIALHDWLLLRSWITRLVLLLCLPSIVLGLFFQLQVFSVVMAVILFSYAGCCAVTVGCLPSNDLQKTTYLAVSPIRSSTIAWSRCLFNVTVTTTIYSLLFGVFALWLASPENRAIWMDWAEQVSAQAKFAGSPLVVGLRLSTAILLGWAVFFIGRMTGFLWIGSTGRSWVAVVATIISALVYLVPFGLFLRWMMRQTDWEIAQATAWQFVHSLPRWLVLLLIFKVIAATIISMQSLRSGMIQRGELVTVVAIWLSLWLLCSMTLWALLPVKVPIAAWIAALTALAIPLARVIALPLAIAWNRHR